MTTLTLEEFRALPRAERVAVARTAARPVSLGLAVRLTVMLGRPRTCMLGVVAFLLGHARVAEPGVAMLLGGCALTLVAGLVANLANAYTDIEEDCGNLPGRVWLVCLLGRRRLAAITAGLTVLALLIAVPFGPGFTAFTLVGLVLMLQYSLPPLRLKAHPFLGLAAFSWAVTGPFLIGYFGALGQVRVPDAGALAVFAFLFLWGVAKGMVKNVPDFAGDTAAGLRTSATVFPSQRAAATGAAGVTVLAYLTLPLLVLAGALPVLALAALVWVPVALAQGVRLVRATEPAAANTVLRQDMFLSLAFLVTVQLLAYPGLAAAATIVACVGVLMASDLLALDSRRRTDATAGGTR